MPSMSWASVSAVRPVLFAGLVGHPLYQNPVAADYQHARMMHFASVYNRARQEMPRPVVCTVLEQAQVQASRADQ